MRLRGFGLLLEAQIVAQDYLDIDTIGQPGRRLKFGPGEKFLIQDGGHPFRLGPVVDNGSVHAEITKIIDGHHAIAFQMEPRPGVAEPGRESRCR